MNMSYSYLCTLTSSILKTTESPPQCVYCSLDFYEKSTSHHTRPTSHMIGIVLSLEYRAPFNPTCTGYGYTVIGKGTTSGLWREVSREALVYQILRKAKGPRYLCYSLRLIWQRFTFFMVLERFATCWSWDGEAKAPQRWS